MPDRNCVFKKNRCQHISTIIYEYYDTELSQFVTLFLGTVWILSFWRNWNLLNGLGYLVWILEFDIPQL